MGLLWVGIAAFTVTTVRTQARFSRQGIRGRRLWLRALTDPVALGAGSAMLIAVHFTAVRTSPGGIWAWAAAVLWAVSMAQVVHLRPGRHHTGPVPDRGEEEHSQYAGPRL